MTLSRNVIIFIVATISILFAAVQPWIWSFYTVCIFAAFLIEMILPLGLGYTLSLGNWEERLSLKALMSTDRPNFQFFLAIGLTVMVLALVFSKSRAGITE